MHIGIRGRNLRYATCKLATKERRFGRILRRTKRGGEDWKEEKRRDGRGRFRL